MTHNTLKSWVYVIIQAILLIALVFLPPADKLPPDSVFIIGLLAQLIGLVIIGLSLYDLRKSLTALPLPKKHGVLQIHGLYKHVRHPMYAGVLMLSLGIAVMSGSLIKYALVAGLWALFTSKARYEELLLISTYPGYRSYINRTPRFIPTIRRD